jgi:hypothetical protein
MEGSNGLSKRRVKRSIGPGVEIKAGNPLYDGIKQLLRNQAEIQALEQQNAAGHAGARDRLLD